MSPKEVISAFRKFGYVMKLRMFQHPTEPWLYIKVTYEHEIVTPELENQIRSCLSIRKLFLETSSSKRTGSLSDSNLITGVQLNNFSEQTLPLKLSKHEEKHNIFFNHLNYSLTYKSYVDTLEKSFKKISAFII